MKRHAADVAAFIEALGEPVHLVGHSRGGPVALAVAVDRPQLVRKLVLADPALLSLVSPSGSAADDPRVKRARMAETYFRRGDIEGGLRYFFDDVNGPSRRLYQRKRSSTPARLRRGTGSRHRSAAVSGALLVAVCLSLARIDVHQRHRR